MPQARDPVMMICGRLLRARRPRLTTGIDVDRALAEAAIVSDVLANGHGMPVNLVKRLGTD